MHFVPAQPVVSWCVLRVYLCLLTSPIFLHPFSHLGLIFPSHLSLCLAFGVMCIPPGMHSSCLGAADTIIPHLPCSSVTSGRWIRFSLATFPPFFPHIPSPALLSHEISAADVVQNLFLTHLRSLPSSDLWRMRWYFVIPGVFPHISCPCSPLEMWWAHWCTSSCLTLLPPN